MWLASSQANNSVTIWNFDAEKEIRQLNYHEAPISSVKFHPNQTLIFTGDITGRLIVSDITRNRKRSDIKLHNSAINGIRFTSDQSYFYTFSNDSTIKKHSTIDLKLEKEFKLNSEITALNLSKDEQFIIAGFKSGAILIIDAEGKQRTIASPISSKIMDLISDQSLGENLIVVYENGSLYKLNILLSELSSGTSFPIKVKRALFSGNKEILVVGRGENEMLFLNTESLKPINKSVSLKKKLDPYDIALQTVHYTSDSGFLFIPDYDYSILCVDSKDFKEVRRFKGLTEEIRESHIHPNGNLLGIVSETSGARIIDLKGILETKQIKNDSKAYSLDFSPNGKMMAISYSDSVIFYSTSTWTPEQKYSLMGEYPYGNTTFITDKIYAKKDSKYGLHLFDIDKEEQMQLKIKEAFQFKSSPKDQLLAVKSGQKQILLFTIPKLKKRAKIKTEELIDFDLNKGQSEIMMLSGNGPITLSIYDDLGKLKSKQNLPKDTDVNKIKCINDSGDVVVWNTSVNKSDGAGSNTISLFSKKGDLLNEFKGASSIVNSVVYAENQELLLASSDDGTIKVWPILKNKRNDLSFPVSIFPLQEKEFVITMNDGGFDATRAAMEDLHYVQGKEYISLDQLKDEYYEPHLLSKLFGFNSESVKSRSVINTFDLYPEIRLQHPNTNGGVLGVDLIERNGGLGDVIISINGKMAKEILKESSENANHLKYKIEGHPFLKPNEINTISVRAKNQKGNLISGKKNLMYISNDEEREEDSKYYAIIVGVSDYQGNKMDLDFASKDANDISEALDRGAHNFFGDKNVEIIAFNSNQESTKNRPSKENISREFKRIAKEAKPKDVFLFYFAGHGIQGKGEDDNYYLLTEEASKIEMNSLENAEKYSISNQELSEWLGEISSNSTIMILDACHSGEMINKFSFSDDYLSGKEVKALEKLIDETGMYILAGSESSNVSYETSIYGQGLLTYSLLFGMKGEGLRDGEFLDVNKLFQFATNKVPQLASSIGGVQQPVAKIPISSKGIDIGLYGNVEKSKIELVSPRPVVLASSFQDKDLFLDLNNLGYLLDKELRSGAKKSEGDYVFLNSGDFNGAYKISGRYSNNSSGIEAKVRIFKRELLIDEFNIEASNIDEAARQISLKTLEIIERDFSGTN